MENDNLERIPGSVSPEQERAIAAEQDFAKSFESGVPPFTGQFGGEASGDVSEKQYGIANPDNDYYGEASQQNANTSTASTEEINASADVASAEPDSEYVSGVAAAAALVNYGIGAASEAAGSMESLFQKLKGFDASGREDPIGDFYKYLGVDTPAEAASLQEENAAAASAESAFRDGVNAPSLNKSTEGAIKAISDMRELIAGVEGADPRFAEVRAAASAAGMGCFDYIAKVALGGEKNLMGVLNYLSQQRESADQEPESSNHEPEPVIKESEDRHDTLNPEILTKESV